MTRSHASTEGLRLFATLLAAGCALAGPAAAQACGDSAAVDHLGGQTLGSAGVPRLAYEGSPVVGRPFVLRLEDAAPGSFAAVGVGSPALPFPDPVSGGTFHVGLPLALFEILPVDASGRTAPVLAVPSVAPTLCGARFVAQGVVLDPAAVGGVAVTAGLDATVGTAASSLDALFPYRAGMVLSDASVGRAVASDLDGDGTVDLVMPPRSGQLVSIRTGLGDGSFASRPTIDLGVDVRGVAVGDLDGDGVDDLALIGRTTSVTDAVHVLLGAGDGTFGSAFTTPASLGLRAIELADTNGDGALDAVCTSIGTGVDDIVVFEGVGDGTLLAETRLATVVKPSQLAVGDVDLDGFADAVTAGTVVGTPTLHLGSSSGLGPAQPLAATAGGVVEIALADHDGDGALDVVLLVGGTVGSVGVQYGRGDGSFETFVHSQLAGIPDANGFDLGDFDGDGVLDAVVRGFSSQSAAVLVGRLPDAVSTAPFEFPAPLETGLPFDDLITADFDSDAEHDALFVARQGSLLHGNGDGTFSFSLPAPASYDLGLGTNSIDSGDLDGDGFDDVVTSNLESDDFSVLLSAGDGSFAADQPFDAGAKPALVRDLNGDGLADLLTIQGLGALRFYPSIGGGDFGPKITSSLSLPSSGLVARAVGDMDGDGVPDVVQLDAGTAGVSVHLGNGDGSFVLAHTQSSSSGVLRSVALGDLDGDGDLDVVVPRFTADRIRVLPGVGDGTLASGYDMQVGDGPFAVAVGDLDRDGSLDLVAANAGVFTVRRGKGDGSFFFPALDSPTGDVDAPPILVDLDGDRRLDLVTNGPSVALGLGDGTFGPARLLIPKGDGSLVSVLDLDGDGAPDVVSASEDGHLSVFLNHRYD